MKVIIAEQNNTQKELTISLTPKEMEPYLKRTATRASQSITIKGFRKGKAPYDVIQQHVGREALWNEAGLDAIEQSYQKALKENNIEPAGRPKVDITKLVAGNEVEFKATVPLAPTFELPEYKQLAQDVLDKEKDREIDVHEHEVDDALEYLQQNYKDQNNQAVLPPLDDEFAKQVGKFQTLEELKNSIREGMAQEQAQHNKEVIRLKIVEKIRKNTTIEISSLLVENELTNMEDEFQKRVTSLDVTVDDYLKKMGKTMEDLKDGWKEKAQGRIESFFILRAIARKEKIEPTSEEVAEHANRYLRNFATPQDAEKEMDPEALQRYIYDTLQQEKVLEFLNSQKSHIIKPS